MAQTYNFDGVNIVIPGSYVKTTVINTPNGIATTGVIALVGEADSGPAYDDAGISKDLKEVAFTPDQFALMKNQFQGGPLVEAFNAAVAPLLETGLAGGPTLVYCLKTNATDAAEASLELQDGASTKLADIKAKNSGTYGNDIALSVSTGDVDGTTGFKAITIKTSYGTTTEEFKVNTTAALKFEPQSQNNKITITETTIQIEGSTLDETFVLANYLSLDALIAAINVKCSSATLCSLYNDDLKFKKPVGLLDVGVTGPTASPLYIGVCGYQLAEITSQLVDVVPTYTKPVLSLSAKLSNGTASGLSLNLAGGNKGASTQADIKAALAKLENIRLNFVVPLFSEDGDDYTIEEVIADTVDHVTNMSKIKARRNRQAFLSLWDTYSDVKAFVADSSKLKNTPYQYRTSMAFQKVTVLNSAGVSETFAPWMTATLAAASQAVAGYRPIFNKSINCSAIVDPTGFNEDYEGALMAGLLTMRISDSGFAQTFLSDQTTYLFPDNNFVYNSIQAVYGADVIAMTLQQQMQTFVGQSVADVTAGVALSFLKSVLANLLRNKWIAPSNDAPAGFKNASVAINAPVMNVAVEVKESTGIYFVPINLSISGVSSTAT